MAATWKTVEQAEADDRYVRQHQTALIHEWLRLSTAGREAKRQRVRARIEATRIAKRYALR